MSKALALFSGGLDSMLAARVVMDQSVEVLAIQFITPFFNYKYKGREDEASKEFLRKYGINVKLIDASREFIEMIRNPRYGYGRNFNPCLDCKIFMMRKAKALMPELGADFIVSGEVLGQRPMSQRRDAMRIVERDSGLDGILLRPLTAKNLKPTEPELRGLVDRDRLLAFSGRSRRAQMELATAYGITDYQTPAGGCLLTDPVISRRIEGLLKAGGDVLVEDILILAVGRHFKLPGGMLYVGRNEKDNMKLLSLARKGDYIFKAGEIPGPVSLYRGGLTDEDIGIAASITVRYSDARAAGGADVDFREPGGPARTITAAPALDSGIVQYRLDY